MASATRPFPKPLTTVGWFVVFPSLLLAIEQTWEKTILTLNSGPQMVGFTLLHTGIGIPLLLAFLGGIVWLLAVGTFALLSRSLGGTATKALVACYLISWGLLEIPYGFWQRVFVEELAQCSHAIQFVAYAAAVGDLETVKSFLAAGVPVNTTDGHGGTALHAAAIGGQVDVTALLISRGADVNAVNRYGDSPLEYAVSGGKVDVARVLAEHGARRIRGSDEQHHRVSSEIVHEDMDALDRNGTRSQPFVGE